MAKKDFIVIGGVKFDIEHTPGIRDEERQPLHGDTDTSKRIIRINSSDPRPTQHQTLFHECIHAIIHISGHSATLTEQQEEAITLALDHLLWPILPELLRRAKK